MHSRNASTDDVTAQYVDTESRVKTMQASVDRVRALMSQATKLGEIVALEAELSRRQADLEATQSQLAALKDSVALAPVEVRLSTDEQVLAEADDSTGFLAGLKAGWTAFTGSVTVLLTAGRRGAPVRRPGAPWCSCRCWSGCGAAPRARPAPAQPAVQPRRPPEPLGSRQSCSVTQSRRSRRKPSGSSIDGRWAASGRSTRRTCRQARLEGVRGQLHDVEVVATDDEQHRLGHLGVALDGRRVQLDLVEVEVAPRRRRSRRPGAASPARMP